MEKGDFLLVELEGRDEKGGVFDSTKGEIAKKLYGKEGPLLVILGITPMLKGVEEELYMMEEGEERDIIVQPEKGFGFRDKKNTMVVPISQFERIPHIGDVVSIETYGNIRVGIVVSVNSGRVLLDLNHPLAGKTTYFKIKIVKKLSTDKEKAEALLRENVKDFSIEDNKAIIKDKLSEEEKNALKELFKNYSLNFEFEFKE